MGGGAVSVFGTTVLGIMGLLTVGLVIGLVVAIFKRQKPGTVIAGSNQHHDGESSGFLLRQTFEDNWIENTCGRPDFTGFKYCDEPGCYVILIFSNPVVTNRYENFDDVYVGQSIHMYKRVHDHFTGKGNGDVYADIRNGKHAYVKFHPCSKKILNDVEKMYIEKYNAIESYNKTRGGSAKR